MAASRRAAKRRARARGTRRRNADPLPLILQIEVPLRDAMNFVDALRLIGHGLTAHDETGGDAVAALAYEAGDRLETVKTLWNGCWRRDERPERFLAPVEP